MGDNGELEIESSENSYGEQNQMRDPRNIGDLEEENIDLKQQLIHAMLTLEQYLSVAYIRQ